MIKKLVLMGVMGAVLSASTVVFAADVFVTQNGKKYHKEICRLIKKKESERTLDKKAAIEEGYSPCKRCFREDLPSGDNPDLKEKEKK